VRDAQVRAAPVAVKAGAEPALSKAVVALLALLARLVALASTVADEHKVNGHWCLVLSGDRWRSRHVAADDDDALPPGVEMAREGVPLNIQRQR